MSIQPTWNKAGLHYAEAFTRAHQSTQDIYLREKRCQQIQFPACLKAPQAHRCLVGKRNYFEIGYSLQDGGLGYYAKTQDWPSAHDPMESTIEEIQRWDDLRTYWNQHSTIAQCKRDFSPEILEHMPDEFPEEGLRQTAYPLYRMSGLQLDFKKWVKLGLCGLRSELYQKMNRSSPMNESTLNSRDEPQKFIQSILDSLDVFESCIDHYRSEIEKLLKLETQTISHRKNLERCYTSLKALKYRAPQHFHEGLQLVLLTTTFTSTLNYGRLDDALGPLLCKDLDSGHINWEEAIDMLGHFYEICEEEIWHFDGRIIIGGKGRQDPSQADRFAFLAMDVTERLNLPMPQLSLRFYDGQNPELLKRAYEVIAKGKTFPMLYNDDINISAVMNSFGVDLSTAEQYLPFGCGEYMIDHRSCGTPNGIINLNLCLESALHHGKSLNSGHRLGPDFGGLENYTDFEDLWQAYDKTVQHYCRLLAQGQDSIYKSTGSQCPFSLVSALYDHCIERGQSIFAGGLDILGGTNETYGNTNTADSLTAIKALIFDAQDQRKQRDQTTQHQAIKSVTPKGLLEALRNNWKGHEQLRKVCLDQAKYGNDDAQADAMLCRVHDHICHATRSAAKGTDLSHFLVVVINNETNTLWGEPVSASPDGRAQGAPLAPGNAPAAGADRSGLTAALNSQAKPNPRIHAGAVQNIKLSSNFTQNTSLYHTVMNTYFKLGGAQAMISVTRRADLEKALREPEHHAHLMVRVGGFSARFVDLCPQVQKEVLSRTEHR